MRHLDEICLVSAGIPYATAEVAFLFKAKHVREKTEADFQRELSAMNGWLPESTLPPVNHTSWPLRSVPLQSRNPVNRNRLRISSCRWICRGSWVAWNSWPHRLSLKSQFIGATAKVRRGTPQEVHPKSLRHKVVHVMRAARGHH